MTNHSVNPKKHQEKAPPELFSSGPRGTILMNSNELIRWTGAAWWLVEYEIKELSQGRHWGWRITHCQAQSEVFKLNLETGRFEKRTNYWLSQKLAIILCKRINPRLVPALRRAFIDEHFADLKQQLALIGASDEVAA